MAEMYAVSGETLSTLANAIRTAAGTDDFMTVAGMAAKLEGLPVRKETVVQDEDWPTGTEATTFAFFQKFMGYGSGQNGITVAIVTNNTYDGDRQQYAAKAAVNINKNGGNLAAWMRGPNYASGNIIATNYTLYIGVGSTIDIYHIDWEE